MPWREPFRIPAGVPKDYDALRDRRHVLGLGVEDRPSTEPKEEEAKIVPAVDGDSTSGATDKQEGG